MFSHCSQAEYEAQKKADGKRSRDDADKVKEMLFRAFEKHQYYSLRDLHTLTKQPLVSPDTAWLVSLSFDAKTIHINKAVTHW